MTVHGPAGEPGPAASFGLRSLSPRPVLAYHEFSPHSSRDVYQMKPEAFAAQLCAVQAASAHSCAKPQNAAPALPGVEITFDDAHRSQVELAAPLLEEAGLRGLFFAPAGWVGTRAGTANWADLRMLLDRGHRVGSHGDTHALLTHCTPAALQSELVRSRQRLEDHLAQAVETISMPGGRWNVSVAKACADAGYRLLYTSEAGRGSRHLSVGDGEITLVGRLIVRRTMSTQMVAAYAAGSALVTMRLQAEYQVKRVLKQALGDAGYQDVWRRWLRAPVESAPQHD